MAELGGCRLGPAPTRSGKRDPRREADARGDFWGDFPVWREALWPAVERALGRLDLVDGTRLRITAEATQLPGDAPVLAGQLFSAWVELSRLASHRQVQ